MTDSQTEGELCIVQLQGYWTLVGYRSIGPTGLIELRRARCIRRWGTTSGLFQLKDGPLNSTTLDTEAELVRFHPNQEVMHLPVGGDWYGS